MEQLSYDHGVSSERLVGLTLAEHFDRVVAKRGDADAIISCPQSIRLSYNQLKEAVDNFAGGLLRLGAEQGDRVGIWSANNVEWVICQLATAKIGVILVNINPAYKLAELEYALKQSAVKMLVFTYGHKANEYISMLEELAPEQFDRSRPTEKRLPDLEHLILIGQHRQGCDVTTFDAVAQTGASASEVDLLDRAAALEFNDPINIQYTSGTTGFPKGVTLTHHNLLNNALYAGEAMGITPESRFCVPMPFYHCGGMVLCTLATLARGGALVIPSSSFDAGAVLAAVAAERCTHLAGVPTMYIEELEHPRFQDYDLSSLTGGFMAGAPCPVELMRRVNERMHLANLVIFYGLTECSPVITSTTTRDTLETRATTVGRVIPHLEMKIVDPQTRRVVPRGVPGEICARGYAVMLGYWNNRGATAEAIDEVGWLRTGDLGVMNDSGYLHITGRAKDMVIRGGENIYPREIEEFLLTHPAISQAYAFGVPDSHLGEELALWVKLRAGVTSGEDDIKAWLKERVAHFKVPRYIKFVSEFPMTVTGKVQKFAMRDAMIGELGLQREAAEKTA